MKIIFLTDIHDALKDVRTLFNSSEADLYLVCGDILYRAFYDEEKIYQFVCLQEDFQTLAKKLKIDSYPYDLASDILRFPSKYEPKDLGTRAREYRQLFKKAAKTMKEKYQLLEEIIQKYCRAPCNILPGNYDTDPRYTALGHRSLHHSFIEHHNFRFAGYGGAPIMTPGIPEKLAVPYHEKNENGELYSEPQGFFEESQPDVLVLHNPAYGYFDRIPTLGHVGSQGIRNYLDRYDPLLAVSGHIHEDYGVALKNKTLLLNSSNFGGVDSPYGWQPGGTYAEILLEKEGVSRVNLLQLQNNAIFQLMEVHNEGGKLIGRISSGHKNTNLDMSSFVRDSSGAPL